MWVTVLEPGSVAATVEDLRRRDGSRRRYEVQDPAEARAVLRDLPLPMLALVAAAAGPRLSELVRAASGDDPEVHRLLDLLGGPFLPATDVVPVGAPLLPAVREVACGRPGDPVPFGRIPAAVTRLGRMVLARQGGYPRDDVLAAAHGAYRRDAPYGAHDALACAFVHPGVTADERADLMWRHSRPGRGWRSRKGSWRVFGWAIRHGHLRDHTACACGHHRAVLPPEHRLNRWEATHWADRWARTRPLLDDGLRCPHCHGYWAEERFTADGADLRYGRPVGVVPG